MKYLLLMLVVLGLVFLSGVRKGRAGSGQAPGPGSGTPPRTPPAGAEAAMMVSCAECGTHLPEAEAYPGRGGHFCSAEHRQRHEARQGHG
ncbi:MAG TPA: PP0621 family protein [Burkholderiaceae bacterium]|nr:PP0621 family protein [Burkholderiaceae bacterium]